MQKKIVSTLLAASLITPAALSAGDYSVGTQVGIFGFGANVKYKVNEEVGVRAGFDLLSMNDFEVEDEEVNYNFDVSLQDVMIVADWHPWKGSFKTTAGLIINGSNVDGDITPGSAYGDTIEFSFNGTDYSYSVDELGAIETTAEFDPVAPYIGIGWDTSFDKKSGFGFTCDLGIAFQGSMQTDYDIRFGDSLDPEVATADITDPDLKAEAIAEIEARQAEIRAELQADLDNEMSSLQDELDKYKIVPYISVGFNYKF